MLPDLPIGQALPELRSAIASGNAVLVAPPGAGKTTVVPLALMDEGWVGGLRLIMLEPRRLAARAAAARMASLLGEQAGARVGYRTRLESAVSAATRVEVITEGLLLRRLMHDPGLDGVAAVLFDEVHERSLDSDLALALCLDVQRLFRPDLRLLAMSATLDGARFGDLLGGAVVESAGRMFPVEMRHAGRDVAGPRDLPEAMARTIRTALGAAAGDVLAFLPGRGEIERTGAMLDGCGALVLPLCGDLPPARQDAALRPGDLRRVVLATSIAETSLTVPGVRIVVDGGWRRTPRFDPGAGLSRLTTVRISKAAAAQRAGRAGREGPGIVFRLWTTAAHRGLPEHDRPEMLEADLSGLVLACAAWGTAPGALPFLDVPPPGALLAARALLEQLGAMDGSGITALGREMAGLGAHPRLAAMMLSAGSKEASSMAADLAALLEERDPLRDGSIAIGARLDALGGSGAGDRGALGRIREQASRYKRRLGVPSRGEGDPGALLATAFPDRIGQRREPGKFRFSGGGGASVNRDDSLAVAPFIVVAALDQKRGSVATLAAPLDPNLLPPTIAAQVTETIESGFDAASGSVIARRRRRLGQIVLEDRSFEADPAQASEALAAAAIRDISALGWSQAARQLQARAALLRGVVADVPDIGDDALMQNSASWLAPALLGMRRLQDVATIDLMPLLRARLGIDAARRIDSLLPTHIDLPGGRAAVDYSQPVPVAEARAQQFYGLDRTPLLADGRIPLRLGLLSPAGRPIAITGDLAQFWRGAWADARRDMRGRYPRHDWPERPWEPAAAKAR